MVKCWQVRPGEQMQQTYIENRVCNRKNHKLARPGEKPDSRSKHENVLSVLNRKSLQKGDKMFDAYVGQIYIAWIVNIPYRTLSRCHSSFMYFQETERMDRFVFVNDGPVLVCSPGQILKNKFFSKLMVLNGFINLLSAYEDDFTVSGRYVDLSTP